MKAGELTELAEQWLRARFPESHIRRELSLAEFGGAAVDVAAICADQIVGVEVKGDGDSPSRLKLQGNMYGRVCRKVYLLASPDLTEKCQRHCPPEWSMLYAPSVSRTSGKKCDVTGLTYPVDFLTETMSRGTGYGLAPAALAAMLWTTEYGSFRAEIGEKEYTALPSKKHEFIRFVAQRYPLGELEPAICRTLRKRSWFDSKTDIPAAEKAA